MTYHSLSVQWAKISAKPVNETSVTLAQFRPTFALFTKIAAVTECDHLHHVIHFEHDFILLLICGLLKQLIDLKTILLPPL